MTAIIEPSYKAKIDRHQSLEIGNAELDEKTGSERFPMWHSGFSKGAFGTPGHSRARRQRIIALASCKGGVGKTWLSITLSQALADLGLKVLLIDAHFSMAHVGIQLGLETPAGLGSVLDHSLPLREVVQNYPEGGFDIIAGRADSRVPRNVGGQGSREIVRDLQDLAGQYDTVIMDMESKLNPASRRLLDSAGTVMVVVTCDPASVASAYDFIRSNLRDRPKARFSILVNAVDDLNEGHRTYEMLRQACVSLLDVDPLLAGVVRADDKVHVSIMDQVPMLKRFPDSDATVDVELIAANLLCQARARRMGDHTVSFPTWNGRGVLKAQDRASAVEAGLHLLFLDKDKLPDGSGRPLAGEGPDVGIVLMSLKEEGQDRAIGYRTDTDDCGGESVTMREFLARFQDTLKPVPADEGGTSDDKRTPDGVVRLGGWEIDLRRREAVALDDGRIATLTRAEFDVVAALVLADGLPVSRDYLLDVISRRSLHIGDRTVDTLISRIRQKLRSGGMSQDLILTERGIGYRANIKS